MVYGGEYEMITIINKRFTARAKGNYIPDLSPSCSLLCAAHNASAVEKSAQGHILYDPS